MNAIDVKSNRAIAFVLQTTLRFLLIPLNKESEKL